MLIAFACIRCCNVVHLRQASQALLVCLFSCVGLLCFLRDWRIKTYITAVQSASDCAAAFGCCVARSTRTNTPKSGSVKSPGWITVTRLSWVLLFAGNDEECGDCTKWS